jgi:lysophospholipase L1-like esterase
MRFTKLFQIGGILLLSSTAHADHIILPDDPRIQYSGRVDFSNPQRPRFDWSAVSIQIHFKGPAIAFLLEDAQNRFDVWVDGKPQTVLTATLTQSAYTIDSLGAGEHKLQLVRRTEASFGPTTFLGLSLPDGVELLAAPAPLARKIEVIGDSWVCGYGNESPTVHCDNQGPYENANRSFAMVAARELKAEAHLVCYSGRGVVRNYGDLKRHSDEPFPLLLDRLLCGEPQSHWDYSTWTPDVVVIHLGTNDFSTMTHPDAQDFQDSSVALLVHLRSLYPQASLFWFSATGWPDYYPSVEKAVTARNDAGDAKVYCVGYPPVPQDQMGCDFHPNVKVHQKLATLLARAIRQKLGW